MLGWQERWRVMIMIVPLAIAAAATTVHSHGGDPSLVHSCVKKGKPRIVGPSDTCKSGETALDWPKGAGGGSGLVLKDANGAVLGPFDTTFGNVILTAPDATPVVANPGPEGFNEVLPLFYESTDCSGSGLVLRSGFSFVGSEVGVHGGTLYYAPTSATTKTVQSRDFRPTTAGACPSPFVFISPDRCCCPKTPCFGEDTEPFASPKTLDISGFVPPFHAEITP